MVPAAGAPLTRFFCLLLTWVRQEYAEQTYNVLLGITSMSACDQFHAAYGAAASPAAAPAPAAARKLLM